MWIVGIVTGSVTVVGAAREPLGPSAVMRADEPDAGMRTLLGGMDGEGTDGAEDADDAR